MKNNHGRSPKSPKIHGSSSRPRLVKTYGNYDGGLTIQLVTNFRLPKVPRFWPIAM